MIIQMLLGILAVASRRGEFDPAAGGQRHAVDSVAKRRWKSAVEAALGGLIVVVAVGARLALAYGWIH